MRKRAITSDTISLIVSRYQLMGSTVCMTTARPAALHNGQLRCLDTIRCKGVFSGEIHGNHHTKTSCRGILKAHVCPTAEQCSRFFQPTTASIALVQLHHVAARHRNVLNTQSRCRSCCLAALVDPEHWCRHGVVRMLLFTAHTDSVCGTQSTCLHAVITC